MLTKDELKCLFKSCLVTIDSRKRRAQETNDSAMLEKLEHQENIINNYIAELGGEK